MNQTHTVEYLKTRIQSKQGQDGLRIIPAHIQVLIFNGRECQDDEKVSISSKLSSKPSLTQSKLSSKLQTQRLKVETKPSWTLIPQTLNAARVNESCP